MAYNKAAVSPEEERSDDNCNIHVSLMFIRFHVHLIGSFDIMYQFRYN